MIDLVPRPDRYGAEAPEPRDINALIQARIDGRLSRREMIRRAAALGIAAPVVGVMLHATSDDAFGAPREARAVARQDGGPLPVTGPTAPEGTPRAGGTITVGTNREPDTLNPFVNQTVTSDDVTTAVVEGMLAYDSTQQLFPVLATAFEIAPDGLTYTFTLRQGVKFHSGDPFTGQDVVETWKMIMNPDYSAYNQKGWDTITDIKVEGDRLTITTKEVFAPFMSYVGVENIAPAAEIAKGPEPFVQEYGRTRLIGTGPFRFVEWRAKEQVVLEKSPDYWGEAAKLDRIIYRIVPDDNTQLVQLRTGEIQLVGSAGALTATRVDEALGIENIVVMEHESQAWQHIDLKHVLFLRMPLVRQALDFATPSKDIVEKLLKGRATQAVADVAPINWAYNPNVEPRPYDVEQAKALLAEAGLTPGEGGVLEGKVPTTDPNVGDGEVRPFELELWFVSGDTEIERVCQVIAQSWNSIGVKTTVKNQDISTIWGPEGYQFTPDVMTGCLYSWSNGNDPTDNYYWHSSQIPPTPTSAGGNAVGYFNPFNFQPEIDDLTTRADLTVDQEQRKQLFWQIQELLHEQVPVIFIYWEKQFPAAASNVGGFYPSAFNSLMWNANAWYLTE